MKSFSMRAAWLAAAVALVVGATGQARAGAVVAGFNSTILPRNDDGSTSSVNIGFSIDFYGNTHSSLWVNNNGNVTFGGPLSTFTPFNLYTTGVEIIAPFFADVDTRNFGSNEVAYGTGTFQGNQAFGATYHLVGYYPAAADKLNDFQVLLVNRSDTGAGNFDIVFNYDQIQWETGSASGGSGGLGGASARAGFSNGTAAHSFEVAGSAVNGAFLDSNHTTGLKYNSNVGVAGRLVFEARNGSIIPVVSTPEPSTLASGGVAGLMGLGLAWRRRKAKATA